MAYLAINPESLYAGSILYIKKEFQLENEPTVEGLIVAMSLIGATVVTTCSGALSDLLGRRPMLICFVYPLNFLSLVAWITSVNVPVKKKLRFLDAIFGW